MIYTGSTFGIIEGYITNAPAFVMYGVLFFFCLSIAYGFLELINHLFFKIQSK